MYHKSRQIKYTRVGGLSFENGENSNENAAKTNLTAPSKGSGFMKVKNYEPIFCKKFEFILKIGLLTNVTNMIQ